MNICIFSGRLCKDTQLNTTGKVASNTIAVDRVFNGERVTDFFNLKWLGENQATRAAKFLTKGIKILVRTECQQGSYTNKDGVKVTTHDYVVQTWEFCESKGQQNASDSVPIRNSMPDFMQLPNSDMEVPFN